MLHVVPLSLLASHEPVGKVDPYSAKAILFKPSIKIFHKGVEKKKLINSLWGVQNFINAIKQAY